MPKISWKGSEASRSIWSTSPSHGEMELKNGAWLGYNTPSDFQFCESSVGCNCRAGWPRLRGCYGQHSLMSLWTQTSTVAHCSHNQPLGLRPGTDWSHWLALWRRHCQVALVHNSILNITLTTKLRALWWKKPTLTLCAAKYVFRSLDLPGKIEVYHNIKDILCGYT